MNNGKETSLQEDVNIVDVLVVAADPIEQQQTTTLNSLNLNLAVSIDSENEELLSSETAAAATTTTTTKSAETEKNDHNDDDNNDNNDSTNTNSSSSNNYNNNNNNNDVDDVDDKKINELHNIVDEHHVTSLDSSNIITSAIAGATTATTTTTTSLSLENDERKGHFQTIMAANNNNNTNSKRIRKVHERANSLGKMYQSSRRVSFAENDCDLVTGYLEPANPWASVKPVASISELAELYKESCEKHKSKPIDIIIKHLESLDLDGTKTRRPKLDLRAQALTAESCEPLEELLKRIQYKQIDLTGCGLDDVSATALFDMIEYYEATNEIDISENSKIANRGWQSCCNMIKRSHALQMLATRGTLLSESNATNLGKAMLGSSLHTLKLEHCGLTGRPIASLCIYLRRNTVLKELSLAHNDLTSSDAYNIGIVLKSNFYLQFLDVSNNRIEDLGVLLITEALMEQSKHFRQQQQELATKQIAAGSTTNTTTSAVSSSSSSSLINDKTNDSITSVDTTIPIEIITKIDDKLSSSSSNKQTNGNGNNNGGRSILETLLQSQKQTEMQQQQQQQIIVADVVADIENNDNQMIELSKTISTTPLPSTPLSNNNNVLLIVNPLSMRPATPGPTKKSPPTTTIASAAATAAEIELKIIEDIDVDKQTSDHDLINFDGINIPTVFLPAAASNSSSSSKTNTTTTTTTLSSSLDNNNSLTENDVFFHNSNVMYNDVVATTKNDDASISSAGNVIEEQLVDLSIDTIKNDKNNVKIFDINENNSITNLDSSLEISQSDLIVYNDNGDDKVMITAITTETPPESPTTKSMMIDMQTLMTTANNKKFPSAGNCSLENIFDSDNGQQNMMKQKVQIENSECNENESTITTTTTTTITTTASTQTTATTTTTTTTTSTPSNIVIEKPTELLPHIPLSSSFTSVSSGTSSPNTLLHCTPPTLRKSADNILLTPDSSQSLDSSSLCELSVSFEQSTPISVKIFNPSTAAAVAATAALASASACCAPERSFSSESLNSETSIDSNDSKSSIRLTEAKFSRNGTLERHQNANQPSDAVISGTVAAAPAPSGLQVLIMWNNRITRQAAQSVSDLLAVTKTLEILNIGRNVLSNDFLANIKTNLKTNTSLTNLGLQGAHLTCTGIQTLADVLEFGGNSTLQRIDLRDNNLQVSGLMAINDVLKSNKSVTRIDLDDVPRRGDSSSDSSIDYSRMVNNIRAQCARNENPPEPEAVRTTSIRRLRNTYLNSRKISLTCHTFRSSPSDQQSAASAKVSERNLLDPNRKSAGGRLRSPLPSPIPSPVSSPVPSPSRSSRFQVSRVVETSTSPITPPPSINCSPTTNFPAPISTSTSRFRVTTVVEPVTPSSLLLSSSASSSSVPLSLLPSSVTTTKLTKPKSAPANMNNSMMTNTCLNTNLISTTPNIIATTTTTTNTPINTKEESQPIKISSTTTTTTTTTNTTVTDSKNIEKQTQIIDIPTIQSTNVQLIYPPTLTPPSSSTYKSSISSDQQLATAVSHSISTSFDSPDLEVKRYMDDSCSSISSIESIERHHDFNTSNSSIDSVESLISETIKSPFSSLDGNVSSGGGGFTMLSGCASSIGQLPLSLIDICSSSSKIHDSLSSLETSTCSNDSLDDSQDILTATASAIESSQSASIPIVSSNEGTLTNSPNNVCYCKSSSSGRHQQPQLADDKDNNSSSGGSNSGGGTIKQEKRVRKTSWMMNPMSTTKSDSGYPATLDKLLSLFQHPGNFFTRSSGDTTTATKKESASGGGQSLSVASNNENKPPSRKDSPMGGLFAWTTSSSNRKDAFDDNNDQLPIVPPPSSKPVKSPLQTNISPENTITTATSIGTTTQPSPVAGAASAATTSIDLISGKLKQEMKENISPEHTITAATVMNVKSQANVSSMYYPLVEMPHEKVVFELGGGDEDDEPFQQFQAITPQTTTVSSIATTTTTTTTIDVSNNSGNNNNNNCNIRMLGSSSHTGIGQIARDSLSILKGSSTNSQDSMRSLESLSETQSNIE